VTKTILIAEREFKYYLQKRSFLFLAFGMPLLVMVVMAISIVLLVNSEEELDLSGGTQYGYVDYSIQGIVSEETVKEQYYGELFVQYPDEESARADLDSELIPGYIVISEDYMTTGKVTLYSHNGVPEDLFYYIDNLLIANVSTQIAGIDIPAARVINPAELTIRLEDSGRELSPESFIPLIILPIAFAVIFMMATQVTGSFLMSGLVEEKNNRVMEIMVTSVTPLQLMTGKIIGLGALGIVQLIVWIAVAIAVFVFGADLDFLKGVTFPFDLAVIAVLYFLMGYFLIASIMAGIGAVVGSEQESRQYAGIFTMVFAIPYFFMIAFITNPNGPIPVTLSLIPFTAPMAMVMRAGLTSVPWWQLILSSIILLFTIALFIWAAAKIFRWGLLLYGKSARPRDLIRVVRGNVDPGMVTTANNKNKREKANA
jgi:ABC-2 type transport system permease protein